MTDIGVWASLLPIVGSVIFTYVRLSSRMARMETIQEEQAKVISRIELDSDAHYDKVSKQIDDLKTSVVSVEKAILETSLRRSVEYDNLTKQLDNIASSVHAQEARITNLELFNQRMYEIPMENPRRPRRKGNTN